MNGKEWVSSDLPATSDASDESLTFTELFNSFGKC